MSPPALCRLRWQGREVEVEHAWVGVRGTDAPAGTPLVVFLHEGLGSVSMWRDFPQQLCAALGWRGLVYSRPGYGRSTPRAPDEHWQPDFMHQQALQVLPALLQALGVDATRQPLWLFGHSDGGSIALLHAAHGGTPLAGLVVLAPHVKVEEVSVTSIRAAREAYLHTDLRQRLARHHTHPDSAFWGWNGVWLSDAFRSWDIRPELARITCPVLAIQGLDDEYGTLAQIRDIRTHAPQTRLLELPACGHSPHKDQPEAVVQAVTAFAAAQPSGWHGDADPTN
jgi:pimeloyl-ACP methyl ester carboxylesterase